MHAVSTGNFYGGLAYGDVATDVVRGSCDNALHRNGQCLLLCHYGLCQFWMSHGCMGVRVDRLITP